MNLRVIRNVVVVVYFAYFVLDIFCICLAVDDLKHNYDTIFYVLVITSGLHLVLLGAGIIGQKCLMFMKEYRAYPFNSKHLKWTVMSVDVVLLIETILVFSFYMYDTKVNILLVSLIATATISNILCFFKLCLLQKDLNLNTSNPQIHHTLRVPTYKIIVSE